MKRSVSSEDLELAHKAYNSCSQELEDALNSAKGKGLSPEQLEKISMLNRRCDELLQHYLNAYKACYGGAK